MATKIEVLENELGAKITAVTVSYDRKVSDGNYGSVGSFMSMTTELGPEANAEQIASALYELVREAAEENFKPAFKDVLNPDWKRQEQERKRKDRETLGLSTWPNDPKDTQNANAEPQYLGMEDGPIEDAH
jgi:hypothetical protein